MRDGPRLDGCLSMRGVCLFVLMFDLSGLFRLLCDFDVPLFLIFIHHVYGYCFVLVSDCHVSASQYSIRFQFQSHLSTRTRAVSVYSNSVASSMATIVAAGVGIGHTLGACEILSKAESLFTAWTKERQQEIRMPHSLIREVVHIELIYEESQRFTNLFSQRRSLLWLKQVWNESVRNFSNKCQIFVIHALGAQRAYHLDGTTL